MKLKNNHILCFGEILWDRLPSGSKPGGAPMNVALHLQRFGLSPWLASRVGDDDAGRNLIAFLKQNGLKTGLVQRGKTLPTSDVMVSLDKIGNATYRICEPVAWDNIALTQKLADRAAAAGVFVFGTLAARNEITRNTLLNLLNTAAFRILDINLRPPFDKQETAELLLSKSDFVKMNDHELSVLAKWMKLPWYDAESAMRKIADHFGLSGVCVTRGDNGAVLLLNGAYYTHPGFPVTVEDTVGSGDAFLAALISSFTEKKGAAESLEIACATGSLVATREGATPGYTMDDIHKIIDQADTCSSAL
jgi:fructokinase